MITKNYDGDILSCVGCVYEHILESCPEDATCGVEGYMYVEIKEEEIEEEAIKDKTNINFADLLVQLDISNLKFDKPKRKTTLDELNKDMDEAQEYLVKLRNNFKVREESILEEIWDLRKAIVEERTK